MEASELKGEAERRLTEPHEPSVAHGEGPEDAPGERHGKVEKGSEEAKEHEHITKVTLAIASLLFGFLVFDIILLHLVNWPDANVRSYVYKMVSTTISIFCAVLLNQAVQSFFLDQLLPAPFPRGLGIPVGHKEKLIVGLLLFGNSFWLINWGCHCLRENPTYLYAVQIIGGHITAFSGIATFGHMQWMQSSSLLWVWAVGVIAWLVLLLCRFLSRLGREKLYEPGLAAYVEVPEASDAVEVDPTLQTATKTGLWLRSICEAEDDAVSIIMSFLTTQAVSFTATGNLSSVEGGSQVHSSHHIRRLFYSACIFLLLLILAVYLRSKADSHKHGQMSLYLREVSGIQNFLAMCASWSFLRMAYWGMNTLLGYGREMSQVATAFVLSGLAVVCVIVLDFFADTVRERGCRGGLARETPTPRTLSSLSLEEASLEELQKQLRERVSLLHDHALDTSNVETALRTVINGFGLLVGLCWEKAFNAAGEAIVLGVELRWHHAVIAKILMAIVNALLVLPAWLAFIAPMAKKDWTEHEALMQMERRQSESTSMDQTATAIQFIQTADVLKDREFVVALRDALAHRSDAVKKAVARTTEGYSSKKE